MKTSELSGAELDAWVAKAEGRPHWVGGRDGPEYFSPSTDWAHGGPIIECRKIMVAWNVDHWIAGSHETTERADGHIWTGRTALIAAMRVCVAGAFGEEVPASPQ